MSTRPVGFLARILRSRATESGAVAIIVAITAPVLLIFAAFAVDTARWYVEGERVQKVADAAALAGVPYLPTDLAAAKTAALAVAAANGYVPGTNIAITVVQGQYPTQLKVTVSNTIKNAFAVLAGVRTTKISRTSVSDFSATTPMGSPCNTYGNEPDGSALQGPNTVLPTPAVNAFCISDPKFWGSIEGPITNKENGDRYMNRTCGGGTVDLCTAGVNNEYSPEGYFYTIHVVDPAKTGNITVQIYDPGFVNSGSGFDCASLPASGVVNNMNPYATTDAIARYDNANPTINSFCTGDESLGSTSQSLDTTWMLRGATNSGNPLKAVPYAGCTAQFEGVNTAPTVAQLSQYRTPGSSSSGAGTSYNADLAKTFHQWYPLCTFTPEAGVLNQDYYLQVRTNVAMPSGMVTGTVPALIATDSTTTGYITTVKPNPAVFTQVGDDANVKTNGINNFGIRANATAAGGNSYVSVSGFQRIGLAQHVTGATIFNMIQVQPTAQGKFLNVTVWDPADGISGTGTIAVARPTDSTSTISKWTTSGSGSTQTWSAPSGCIGYGVTKGALTNCSVSVGSGNNGRWQKFSVPIPADYNCTALTLGGCWWRVVITYTQPTDITTWSSAIEGSPIRLIQ